MSLSIVFSGADDGDDGPIHLCSANEWSKFVKWAKGRDDALGTLARDGAVDNTQELSECIADEDEAHPVIKDLAKYVGVGDAKESIKVVD